MDTQLRIQATATPDRTFVELQVQPGLGQRAPADICCVVDVSGSMNQEAGIQNSAGDTERHGLSILDLVKHSIRTIVQMLHPEDTLSIVPFSNRASVALPKASMSEQGKQQASQVLQELEARGGTNLWDGIVTALDLMETFPDRSQTIFVLTDGVPSESMLPEQGIEHALQEYRRKHPSVCGVEICTYGFGYNLDSALLSSIARIGAGHYGFIPDAGFVGTTFIHAMANTLCQVGRPWRLELEAPSGVHFVSGDNQNAVRYCIDLPALQQGQTRTVTVELLNTETNPASILLEASFSDGQTTVSAQLRAADVMSSPTSSYRRLEFIKSVSSALEQVQQGADLSIVQHQLEVLRSIFPADDSVLLDLEGQVKEAFSKPEWFSKWGQHYLRSLLMAHELERCTNFKDPGLQRYAQSDMFDGLRDEADDLFMSLPPPQPSVQRNQQTRCAPRAPVNMNAYHNVGSSCFRGDGRVLMASGLEASVERIRAGDVLRSCGASAVVRCVLKTRFDRGRADMVSLANGLVLTPYHPIKQDGAWVFPSELIAAEEVECKAVYSFVLDRGHVMWINGVECVCLGHGILGDAVASHPFYGTARVVEQLSMMEGWARGLVEVRQGSVYKDPDTELAVGFVPGSEIFLQDVELISSECVSVRENETAPIMVLAF